MAGFCFDRYNRRSFSERCIRLARCTMRLTSRKYPGDRMSNGQYDASVPVQSWQAKQRTDKPDFIRQRVPLARVLPPRLKFSIRGTNGTVFREDNSFSSAFWTLSALISCDLPSRNRICGESWANPEQNPRLAHFGGPRPLNEGLQFPSDRSKERPFRLARLPSSRLGLTLLLPLINRNFGMNC